MTKGVRVPAGETRNLEVDLHCDVDASMSWQINVAGENGTPDNKWGAPLGFDATFVGFAHNLQIVGSAGDKLYLSITRLQGTQAAPTLFVLSSYSSASDPSDASVNLLLPRTVAWPFFVGQ